MHLSGEAHSCWLHLGDFFSNQVTYLHLLSHTASPELPHECSLQDVPVAWEKVPLSVPRELLCINGSAGGKSPSDGCEGMAKPETFGEKCPECAHPVGYKP